MQWTAVKKNLTTGWTEKNKASAKSSATNGAFLSHSLPKVQGQFWKRDQKDDFFFKKKKKAFFLIVYFFRG